MYEVSMQLDMNLGLTVPNFIPVSLKYGTWNQNERKKQQLCQCYQSLFVNLMHRDIQNIVKLKYHRAPRTNLLKT